MKLKREVDADSTAKALWRELLDQGADSHLLMALLERATGASGKHSYDQWQSAVDDLSEAAKRLRQAFKAVSRVETDLSEVWTRQFDVLMVFMEDCADEIEAVKKRRALLRQKLHARGVRITKQKLMLLPVLAYISHITGKPRYEETASLLNAAYRAHGAQREIDSSALKQLRYRAGNFLREWRTPQSR